MDLQTAGNFVRAIAIIGFVEAVLELIMGTIMLIGGTMLGKTFSDLKDISLLGITTNLLVFIGIGILILAVLSFVIALGLWKKQSWARVLTIVFVIIGFFVSLATLPKGIIGVAINGGIFYFLAINKDIAQIFKKY